MGIQHLSFLSYSMRFTSIALLLVLCNVALTSGFMSKNTSYVNTRRLKLPGWAKGAIKGAVNAILGGIIDCLAEELKRLGPGVIAKIPGLKQVAGKFIGAGIDKLKGMLKKVVLGAINGAIDKLRRRQRRAGLFKKLVKGVKKVAKKAVKVVKKAANTVAKGVKAAAAAAGKFAKDAAAVAGKAAAMAQQMAKKLDGLTGGALSKALMNIACPGLAKLMDVAMSAALKAFGWPGNAPACLIKAIENGCKAAVKAAFKRHRMLRALRRLERFIKVHY